MKFVLSSNSLAASDSTTCDPPSKSISKKYNRIGSKKKKQLLEKVFFENKKIKTAAEELGINYSTAKTIFHIHRKKFKKEFCLNSKMHNYAGYKKISSHEENSSQIKLCVTQGGRNINKDNNSNDEQKKEIDVELLIESLIVLIEAVKQEKNKNEVLTEGIKKMCLKQPIIIQQIKEQDI